MPRGGKRKGSPGKSYPNRTDLNMAPRALPAQAATNQPYGQAGQQIAAQQAVPLMTPGVAPPPAAGSLGAFTRPTERPEEPITAGLDIGPGPGSEVLGIGQEDPDAELRAIYLEFPSEDLRELLERREG